MDPLNINKRFAVSVTEFSVSYHKVMDISQSKLMLHWSVVLDPDELYMVHYR